MTSQGLIKRIPNIQAKVPRKVIQRVVQSKREKTNCKRNLDLGEGKINSQVVQNKRTLIDKIRELEKAG